MKEEVKEELEKLDIDGLKLAWFILEEQEEYVNYIKYLIWLQLRVKAFFEHIPRFA